MMVGVQIRKDFRFNFAVSTTKSKENGIKTFLSFFIHIDYINSISTNTTQKRNDVLYLGDLGVLDPGNRCTDNVHFAPEGSSITRVRTSSSLDFPLFRCPLRPLVRLSLTLSVSALIKGRFGWPARWRCVSLCKPSYLYIDSIDISWQFMMYHDVSWYIYIYYDVIYIYHFIHRKIHIVHQWSHANQCCCLRFFSVEGGLDL